MEKQKTKKGFYNYIWRLHFYMGIYVIPFLIMLAVTGLVIMYVAYFDGRYGEKFEVVPQNKSLSILEQEQFVKKSFPNSKILEWIAPFDNKGVSIFVVKKDDKKHLVSVNPYNGEIVNNLDKDKSSYEWFSDIHGTLFIGKTGDALIEIASSFAIILIVTGFYLLYQKSCKFFDLFKINFKSKSRDLWKSLHSVFGVYSSLFLILFLLTGLGWAGVWGGKFVQIWSTSVFPEGKWGSKPQSKVITHESLNFGAAKEIPWGIEKMPLPQSSISKDKVKNINVDTIYTYAINESLDGRFHIYYPKNETGIWSISQNSMSTDMTDPRKDRTIHYDQYTGEKLQDIKYSDYSLMAKAVAYGIALHTGALGVMNLIINTIFCLITVFVCISAVVIWWKRRPSKLKSINAPKVGENIKYDKIFISLIVVLSIFFPLAGLAIIGILIFDFLIISRIKKLKEFFYM